MKIDTYQLQVEFSRTGKTLKELGIDHKLYSKAKKGKRSARGAFIPLRQNSVLILSA